MAGKDDSNEGSRGEMLWSKVKVPTRTKRKKVLRVAGAGKLDLFSLRNGRRNCGYARVFDRERVRHA
eukprot:1589434-Pleurochrysis_carterae.AAC.1